MNQYLALDSQDAESNTNNSKKYYDQKYIFEVAKKLILEGIMSILNFAH